MSESKPPASLSPTLLARKGAARPAMRPQWQPLSNYSTEVPLPPPHAGLEDLGWNDMGDHAADEPTVVPFGSGDTPLAHAFSSGPPEVVRQQDTLAEQIAEPSALIEEPDFERFEEPGFEPVAEPAHEDLPELQPEPPSALIPLAAHRLARAAAQISERRSAIADGRRAAFTLRVDEARHLKLRLACTVQGRSAQQLVTEALDRLLDELPGLDDLAKRARRR
ncbi:MAG: hypothetical protein LC648_09595 [Novosphingobium sp.]|nr:hypothetical protein [Novosphingobium sp.]